MALLVAMLSGAPVGAGHPHPEPGAVTTVEKAASEQHAAQQNTVKACEQKGEHPKLPGACLKKKETKLSAQRQRTRACTQEARDRKLKGFDRVEFMVSCVEAAGPG